MKRTLLLSFLALAFAACQTPDTAEPVAGTPVVPVVDTEADRAAIEALSAEYTAAVQAGDAAAVSALHADDAILHPPNEPSVSGREAIDAYELTAQPVGARCIVPLQTPTGKPRMPT
jgi:hypothetical protein